MEKLLIAGLILISNSGCFLKRSVNTDTGTESETPQTDIVDVETGRFVYSPSLEPGASPYVEVCDIETVELKRGPYELVSQINPIWLTKQYDHIAWDVLLDMADHLHLRSAYASTASGSPIGSFMSSGFASVGDSDPIVWTPEVARGDNTIRMVTDGSIDIMEHLTSDGRVELRGEARVRYPTSRTYIVASATFDVWTNCITK